MGESFDENVIEFLKGGKVATVTFTNGRYASKIKRLAEKFPEEVKILHENSDGSVMAHIPVKYIKINKTERTITEEQREELRERFKKYHASRNGNAENDGTDIEENF